MLTLIAAALTLQAPAPQSPLVVHEWGTFTSMVGSDGLVLEGLQHEEERLPAFVHELASLEAAGGDGRAVKFPAIRVTQKMETPVIYFHTDVPREVTVEVHFPKGILTQFYPIPMLVSPAIGEQVRAPIDLTKVDDSVLVWSVQLLPHGSPQPAEIPACSADDPWSFAREVRSAYVRTCDPEGVKRKIEAEHYIFYRGLARFELPFEMKADKDGHGAFANHSPGRVPFAAALDMDASGGRFVELGAVEPGKRLSFELGARKRESDREKVAAQLGACVFDALVHEGLFEDEARAMVRTWSRSWFQHDGTRVIYVLPRSEVDRVLPIDISPTPDKLVRVLVGRLEFVTPETEASVEQALADLGSTDEAARQRAESCLRGLDRFLEPHVRRALAQSKEPRVLESARRVLATLAHVDR